MKLLNKLLNFFREDDQTPDIDTDFLNYFIVYNNQGDR